ncbi:MAG: dephospho-CoA kinase [Defluviitoga tunisiensis]|jgi:dephospho-CoA kinase|uniref:Dephospho-CoA kinase n=1 Tax=Defluviitoga tunisiensis TaxID=1006576 RepID=A0A0C7NPM0_DEFTU|nr:dephospho-CoA kinase [Defluviitoga tunisiensis]MDD3600401.1 dephospho-CoA kinase [Defluviitoga tunisiensis]MDY0379321.1 dephospho-CoA kinase [Defluviitoga tunisiensis]CEP77837.1 dephospho-CoA kinase [Defluviitoga tunisiensis]HHV00937.1 dephospho-CoA kinase [Defluviitoga tunisiensis]HOB54774.1 dephospho-CoA kinase [Defluviitoga tunisiensis]
MVIGVTGPAGSGKSTVCNLIKKMVPHVKIIDVDRVGHEVLTLFFIKNKIKENFGEYVFDENGNVSRNKLGEIVFSDKNKLDKLNSIVHPVIYEQISKKIEKLSKENGIIILDAALLYKIGLNSLCDKIIYVDASKDKRIERLHKERGLPLNKARNIINSQYEEEFGPYDFKICNDSDLDKLNQEITKVLKEILEG